MVAVLLIIPGAVIVLRAEIRPPGFRGLSLDVLLVRRLGREAKHKTVISMALGLLIAGIGGHRIRLATDDVWVERTARGINFLS
jgi:hypothetical protein